MIINSQTGKPVIMYDNTQIKREVNDFMSRGDLKWNTGATLQEKKDGLILLNQGVKSLKIWLSREQDSQSIKTLQEVLNTRMNDIQQKMTYLEQLKKDETVSDSGQNALQLKKGNKQDSADEEASKLRAQLATAIKTEKPNVKWSDVAGLAQAKNSLIEALIMPKKFAKLYKGVRQPWKAILLYGPPGTGKTHLAKACATEVDATFFQISSADLISKYVGESERLIKALFSMAREKKPSIIFIDEIDSMCCARGEGQSEASRRVIAEFLVQLSQAHDETDIFVLGATNIPWNLDPAIRRRLQKKIYIPLPDAEARAYILKNELQQNVYNLNEQQFQDIAFKTEGFSCSDMSILIQDAAQQSLRKIQQAKQFKEINVNGQKLLTPTFGSEVGDKVKQISCLEINEDQLYDPPITYVISKLTIFNYQSDFLASLGKAKTSISQEQLKEFEDWTLKFGEEGV